MEGLWRRCVSRRGAVLLSGKARERPIRAASMNGRCILRFSHLTCQTGLWIVRIACDQINDRAVTRSILAPHAQADNLVGVKDKIEVVISADSNASILKVNS